MMHVCACVRMCVLLVDCMFSYMSYMCAFIACVITLACVHICICVCHVWLPMYVSMLINAVFGHVRVCARKHCLCNEERH